MPVSTAALLRAAEASFPGAGVPALKLKARFLAAAMRHRRALGPFLAPPAGSEMARLLAARPNTLGALIWPYQCAGWEADERLARIRAHCAEIDRLGVPFTFAPGEKLPLADLSGQHPGLAVVLDKPHWFMREGGLVVNLFVERFRAFSLAFSFYRAEGGALVAVIGGLQGRNRDDALDLYRDLTGALFDLRPRDALLEIFRMLCRIAGVTEIQAVTQAHRHHRHPFFGRLAQADLPLDYDAIWADRDGERIDERFFRLAVDPPRRDLETVKPNKRSLYRKRFAFLDGLEAQLRQDLPACRPVVFADS